MEKKEITREELETLLRELNIKEEGIQAILETFLTERQYWAMKFSITNMLEGETTPKQAVEDSWMQVHRVQKVRMRPVGKEPTTEDFLKL